MNLILYKSTYVDFYTHLDKLFDQIPELSNYHYFISDFETNFPVPTFFNCDELHISGNDLKQIVLSHDVQFIWAAISAFKKKPQQIDTIPLSEYEGAWDNFLKPQVTDAEFEIICWDSTATIFKFIPEEIGNKIMQIYPDIELKKSQPGEK